jgi:hypothetical protein
MFLLYWIIFFVAFIMGIIININKVSYLPLNNHYFLYSFKKDNKTKIYL